MTDTPIPRGRLRRHTGRFARALRRTWRRVLRRPPLTPPPPVSLAVLAEAPDAWLVDLVGAKPSHIGKLAAAMVAWRTETSPEAELVLLVDPEAQAAAERTGLSVITPQSDNEAAVRATIGVTRTVSVRRLDGAGSVAVTVAPTIVEAPRRARIGPPVFIGGTGRSGTWAVGRLLNQHRDLTTVYTELRFHAAPSGYRAVLRGRVTPDEFADSMLETWYESPSASPQPQGLQVIVARAELEAALDRFRARAAHDLPLALRRLMRDLVDPFALKKRARRWVETTPDNVAAARALIKVFPGAQVIHMVRDGRDAAASVATQAWGPSTIDEGLEWWGRRMKAAQRAIAAAPSNRVLTVSLEELVLFDREASFQRLVDFVGAGDSRPVARYFETEMSADAGHLGRWRSDVSREERDHIDGRYREILAELAEVGTPCLPVDPDLIDEAVAAT